MTEFISSDTNVWIDFHAIDAVHLPFKLPCTYLMWAVAIEDEVKSPGGLRDELMLSGLVPVEITNEEFWLADSYTDRYAGISSYDAVALAIAKSHGIVLLTGDRRLRRAAADEGVEVLGTIGVLDRLFNEGIVDDCEYRSYISALLKVNGGVVRLPENELRKRLEHY
ncbi:MAG: PIN domain-containing protein [Atopobiaceae bacterium]|nr:PIN domain-containing protein [Atopobiaceae bacterium]